MLPIHATNIKNVKSNNLADLDNMSADAKYGGSSYGAAFLLQFIKQNVQYIHCDIAGTAVKDNEPTGAMVKGIINFLEKFK
jgi:leucyl aminopeptidase